MTGTMHGRAYGPSLLRWNPLRRLGVSAIFLSASMYAAVLLAPSTASAQEAERVLKSMFDYIGAQNNILMSYDTDIEIVTPTLEKIQFASSGEAALSRPDKVRAKRIGGYADVELVFDGKTVTLAGNNLKLFAQQEMPGSFDQLVTRLRDETGLDFAGADLLLTRGYQDMMADVVESKHIGRGVIDGVECEHLAFRGEDADWQIWVEVGPKPVPRKYVITSKSVNGGPQYTLRVKDWKTDMRFAPETFTFAPSADMKKADLSALNNIDEIPHGTPRGQSAAQGAAK